MKKLHLSLVWSYTSIYSLIWLDAAIPLNKQLYTLSYVCVTAGAAALVFSAFYILVCYSQNNLMACIDSSHTGSLVKATKLCFLDCAPTWFDLAHNEFIFL